jgi:hypothetical protein
MERLTGPALDLLKSHYGQGIRLVDLARQLGRSSESMRMFAVQGRTPSRSRLAREVSLNTVGHELMHLVQGLGTVPNGERACDVFTLARSIKFCDSKPYYLKVPRAFLAEDRRIMPGMQMVMHMVAKEAVRRRKDGERNYIRWFERELASYAEALRE